MRNNRTHLVLLLLLFVCQGLFLRISTPPLASASSRNVNINFQPAAVTVPAGYLVDSGAAFGDRGNGWSYGWSSTNNETRDRNAARSPDQRYDTLNHMQNSTSVKWEIALPAGSYRVHLVAGDAGYYDSVFKIAVEDTLAIDAIPNTNTRWAEGTVTVAVTDGRLTVSNAPGASNNKINFIEIAAVEESTPVNTSATPTPDVNLITNVSAATGDVYLVSKLTQRTRMYIDRNYTFTNIPAIYAGQPFIRTANVDKWATVPDFLRFDLTAAASVYVAYDARVQTLPAWLTDGGWTRIDDTLGSSDGTRQLYRKQFPAGPVVLGGNAMAPMLGAESNYNVIAIAESTPVPTQTASATQTSTATALPTSTVTATQTSTATATRTSTPIPTMTPTATQLPSTPQPASLDQNGTQWGPYLEWSLTNPTYTGNPFDLVATVTFVHQASGETRATEMFYDGENTWKFRFTATQTGTWTFTTTSADPDLAGKSGTIQVSAGDLPGFVTSQGGQWVWSATGAAFVPRLAMYAAPDLMGDNAQLDQDIQIFLGEHGFTGFHVQVYCRWFQLNQPSCKNSGNDPDRRTFEALERFISKTYAAGGMVHLWMYGDDTRSWNPKAGKGGLNSAADRRVQRYIAARLGPLPGWTMGYGFDVWEWASSDEVQSWRDYLHTHMGWEHLLGARYRPEAMGIWSMGLDYAAYEQVRPTYAELVAAYDDLPDKPTFSEDRWRNLQRSGTRDFTNDELRRLMWQTMMAGGVAGIYGDLSDGRESERGTQPFPNVHEFKTLAEFWAERYTLGISRCHERTDVFCLQSGDRYIFYGENVSSIRIEGMAGQSGVAVDARQPYQELPFTLEGNTWTAPYPSDWAIAMEP